MSKHEFHAGTDHEEGPLPSRPYRGIKPLRYADRNVFSAREWEKEQLLNLISLYRGSLLYGESGIGKSSLINAGLIPVLEDYNFQAEVVRISPNREGTFILYRISSSDTGKKNYLPSLFDRAGDTLEVSVSFNDFKQTVLQQKYGETKGGNGDAAAAGETERPLPVIIFDQFEELITLFEESGKKAIADNELSYDERKKLQLELIDFFRECYYNPALRLKFLFVFREDYLAKFSKLFRAIPDLRDHTLRVKAVVPDDIYAIIKCPFQGKASRDLYKAAFSEDEIDLLTRRLKSYFRDRPTILTDIQIVCQYVYESTPQRRETLFSSQDNTGEDFIKGILLSFYEKLLSTLPENEKPLAIDILQLLVLNEQTRNIFHAEAIEQELQSRYAPSFIRSVLVKLDNDTRLVRSEPRSGGLYYEINSESLIPYINSLKKDKEQQERERQLEADLLNERREKEEEIAKVQLFKRLKKKADTMARSALVFAAVCLLLIFFVVRFFQKAKKYERKAEAEKESAMKLLVIVKQQSRENSKMLAEYYLELGDKFFKQNIDPDVAKEGALKLYQLGFNAIKNYNTELIYTELNTRITNIDHLKSIIK